MTLKILNLYAGIGGNRKLWNGDIEVTAVENVPEIAKIYQEFFPKDKVIVTDAHQYLLDHYKEFDFIWSSPPCPSHSVTSYFLNSQGTIRYPDIKLYEEILFLMAFCKSKFCVENVKSYYPPLIEPQSIGRHYLWCNFNIEGFKGKLDKVGRFGHVKSAKTGRTDEKDKLKRNCVEPEIGEHILKCILGKVSEQVEQGEKR
jgi:DNA (cytosine-5)-methyltransferase 1